MNIFSIVLVNDNKKVFAQKTNNGTEAMDMCTCGLHRCHYRKTHINKHQKGKEKESIEHSAADGKVHGVFRETKNSRYIVYMSYFFVAILYIFYR